MMRRRHDHGRAVRLLAPIAAVLLAVTASLVFEAAIPTVAYAQAAVNCGAGKPSTWDFLPEVSSITVGSQVLCNYIVNNEKDELIGGTAITIEYFCSSTAATERFDAVTKRTRDTEVKRSSDLLIIEEGPAAKHKPNPHDDGVTSTFFEGEFNLFEKEWRLLNPQVFATIVVITDRSEELPDSKRASVAKAEPVARQIANANTAGAGCKIGDVGGGSGGSGPDAIVIVGGIGLVAAAATAAVKAQKKKQAAAGAPPNAPVQGVDLSILQIDKKEFEIDASNPATVSLSGWHVGDAGAPQRVPMTIWITAAPGCGVAVVPDQGEGQLTASLSVDPTVASPDVPVQLVANGVWKGKQVSEIITVRAGGDLELRIY